MAWIETAKKAMAKVWNRWGKHIPSELANYKAEDIFRFHDSQGTFDSVFNLTFNTTFQRAGKISCTMEECGAGCAGFVTPTQSHAARMIHINPSNLSREFDAAGMLSHEYIHFLSHPNFYPKYYKQGKEQVFRVEGATEWLMLKACMQSEDAFDLAALREIDPTWVKNMRWHIVATGQGKPISYVQEYEKVNAWIKHDTQNLSKLLAFVFKGVEVDLTSITA